MICVDHCWHYKSNFKSSLIYYIIWIRYMTKPLLFCFDPIADSNTELLILGSMPGQESLATGQYYANRRNAFWKIMGHLLEFDPDATYETRLDELKKARIALWDVLQSCTRVGSLDARIDADSITVNDFRGFFDGHDKIRTVLFNGAKAESTYRQYVLPSVSAVPVNYIRLPSTSPAHAALSYEQKLQAWRAAFAANIISF
jgi:TDG/mug DNA glycosylase family protein